MHRPSSKTQSPVTQEAEEEPSTSRTKDKPVRSYTYTSWKRLRDVCRALQETQVKVEQQKKEVDILLANDKERRDLAEQLLQEKVELQALQESVEKRKCRIMMCRIKLIHSNDEKFQKDLLTNKRIEEVTKLQEDARKRKVTLSLSNENLHLIASHLAWRRKKMVNDLMHIYVINLNTSSEARLIPSQCTCNPVACIAGLHLPNTISILGHSDVEVSSAVGHVVHVLLLLSKIYDIPHRYSMHFFASKSTITDPVRDETFPLYNISRNRAKFDEAMLLLNRNLSQFRWSFGLATSRADKTLPNLHELLLHIVNERCDTLQKSSLKSTINCRSTGDLSTNITNFVEKKLDFVDKVKSSQKVDFLNLTRRASSGSNKSSLLFDSSAIAAITLASPQDNRNSNAKEASNHMLNSNGITLK